MLTDQIIVHAKFNFNFSRFFLFRYNSFVVKLMLFSFRAHVIKSNSKMYTIEINVLSIQNDTCTRQKEITCRHSPISFFIFFRFFLSMAILIIVKNHFFPKHLFNFVNFDVTDSMINFEYF